MTTMETLITKVANAAQGHDSLGPTGLVVHLTPAERDEACAALTAAAQAGEDVVISKEEFDGSLRYATHLAEALWNKHWKAVAPSWKPLPDLLGVLTQIDNMTAGLVPAVVSASSPAPAQSGAGEDNEYVFDAWRGQSETELKNSCRRLNRTNGEAAARIAALSQALAEAEKRTKGKVLLPRHLTPAMACALEGAMQPPWPNGDPHGAIPQLVQDWQQKWANAIAAATKG